MKPRINMGGNQGRDDPRSFPADRVRMARLWPLWVVIAALILILWSIA